MPRPSAAFKRSILREWRYLRAHPLILALASWLPLLACAIMWGIFSAGMPRQLAIAVVDQDQSVLSHQLTRMLAASPGLRIALHAATVDEALAAVRGRSVAGAVVVPSDFTRSIKHGGQATVLLYHDAQFATHSGLIARDVRGVVGTLSAGVKIATLEKRGESRLAAVARFEPIQLKLTTLFNAQLDYESFLAGALLPALLQIFAMTAAVWAVGRELRDATVPDWLQQADGSLLLAVSAKLAPYMAAYTVLAWLDLLWFTQLRGFEIAGSGWTLYLGSALMVAAYLLLGTMAVALGRGMRTGLSIAGFYTAPAFAYAGQGFPILAMPAAARLWANALPLTHYLQLQNQQWMMGAPAAYSLPHLAVLALFCVVAALIGVPLMAGLAHDESAWGAR